MERMNIIQRRLGTVISLLFLMWTLAAYAQVDYSTAILKGTVLDPQNAVITGNQHCNRCCQEDHQCPGRLVSNSCIAAGQL